MASTENSTNPITTNSSSSTGQASARMEDPSLNPFFLGCSDVLVSKLVSQPLTGAENYQIWSRALIVSLKVKHKIGFLNGTIAIPYSSIVCISLIINSILKDIASSVMYTNNVREVYLQDMFSQGNAPKDF